VRTDRDRGSDARCVWPGNADGLAGDDRAVAPVAGKVLEVGLVLLYVALLTTALYGGAVPEYRTDAGQSLADRTLAVAAERIQQAVPPDATRASVRHEVSLPGTIRERQYALRVEEGWLVLDHPHPEVGGRVRLALPGTVTDVGGSWRSDRPAVVRVTDTPDGTVVRLEAG